MKKAVIAGFVIVGGLVLTGNFILSREIETPKAKCIGYTIIEVDKAIDCNGDTIRLTKTNGFYRIALKD